MSLKEQWFQLLSEKTGDSVELIRNAYEGADVRYCGEDGLFSIIKMDDNIALVPQIIGSGATLNLKIRDACRKLGCQEMRGASYRPGAERLYERYGMKRVGVIMGGKV